MDNLLLAVSDVQIRPKVGFVPIPDSCTATKFVLFATSLPRLSIGCAITGLIATAVSNHRQACRRLVERRFLGGEAEPSRAVSARLILIARRTVTCCHTTNADSC